MMNLMGAESMFWTGVVENRIDPAQNNRLQVRIHGFHSPARIPDDQTGEGIELESLPWATPVNSLADASMNGIGESAVGCVEGTLVFGVSMDGRAMQQLFILGTIKGTPQTSPDQSQGFADHDGTLPLTGRPKRPLGANDRFPLPDHLGEPDTHRLARGITKDTLVGQKVTLDGVKIAGGGTWNEPVSAYAAKYPFNKVSESESGHVHEIDDTPDHERLHQIHRTGTFTEIQPDGSKVSKIVADSFEITVKDKNIYIGGDCNITVNGNCNLKAGKKVTVETPSAEVIAQRIDLGGSSTEAIVLGDKMMALFNSHQHTGVHGITSEPIQQMTESELSQQNTTL